MDSSKYYVVKKKAVPEVLVKVLEVKRLLDSDRCKTIQEATEAVGISRSSFYKYKDDIYPFRNTEKGVTLTMMLQVDDTPGLLSVITGKVSAHESNILTIHQSIPINGIASITISAESLSTEADVERMIADLEKTEGVHYLNIIGRE